jgi:hypothetical protein
MVTSNAKEKKNNYTITTFEATSRVRWKIIGRRAHEKREAPQKQNQKRKRKTRHQCHTDPWRPTKKFESLYILVLCSLDRVSLTAKDPASQKPDIRTPKNGRTDENIHYSYTSREAINDTGI